MKAWLIDIYRHKNNLVLWLKTPDDDIRLEMPYQATVYLDASKDAETLLKKHRIKHALLRKRTYHGKEIPVFAVHPPLSSFERFVADVENESRHRLTLYNADVKPEQMFLYENNLLPFGIVEYDEGVIALKDEIPVVLSKAVVEAKIEKKVVQLSINGKAFSGDEHGILGGFIAEFRRIDPDVILMERAFFMLPQLMQRIKANGLSCPFHRWDETELKYRGGRTFFSYGSVSYRDFALRLHGRFLLDTTSAIADNCELDGIIELCQLSGTFFQQVASRSFGAVFQQSLIREMVRQDYLIPYKEKPIDQPMSMFELVKGDRVGHTFDPQTGFHTDVAEIDFSSMYPWIMYNQNISAETMQLDSGPFEDVPGLPLKISLAKKGLVPTALRKILDRRMYYKKHPSVVNNAKAAGLKWVLVSSYGYCRFREFKLGISQTHMAIGAFAREIILHAKRLAEERGFTLIHGIIDSLYLKKEGMTEADVRAFCDELEQCTGIPASFEGIFKWIVFLTSINDDKRPVPARYYGVFSNGEIKARGIEVRQRISPLVVKHFQMQVLERMAQCSTRAEMRSLLPELRALLSTTADSLPKLKGEELAFNVRVSKTDYKHDIAQRHAVEQLKKKGVQVQPGMTVRFVHTLHGVVLLDDYKGQPDAGHYRKLLERALYVLYQPFVRKDALSGQTTLERFLPKVKHIYIHAHEMPDSRFGYSERLIRKRLEGDGWTVWRGGLMNVLKDDEIYPNVKRKYERLMALLEKERPDAIETLQYYCSVHHGMPDFLCYRRGEWKFVECKLIHEQLSAKQKKCIARLQALGFPVEVHKVVDHQTKAREAEVDVISGEHTVVEEQAVIRRYLV
jgi:DNA polymerase elongation subunit (family B)